jgi:exodeoxyribonuclease VII large subunit
LDQGIQRRLADGERRLAHLSELLESYSTEQVLARGYAIVRDADGTPVTAPKRLRPGDAVELHFAKEEKAAAVIVGIPRKRAVKPMKKEQGELL